LKKADAILQTTQFQTLRMIVSILEEYEMPLFHKIPDIGGTHGSARR